MMKTFIRVFLFLFTLLCVANGYRGNNMKNNKLREIFSWKQIGYDFDGICYTNNTDKKLRPNFFTSEVKDSERFFIPYNNVPIGLEVYGDMVIVTVPRRRYGIPSTLNYVDLRSSSSPLLKPYPDESRGSALISVYRPRVDSCHRLWMVDTGLLEVPGDRKQIQQPAVIVFDLKTRQEIIRYQLKSTDLVNERTSGGLTSITVDVATGCDDAYAYINDLATEGLIVFSLKERDSWRIDHPSFKHEESALNFSVAGQVINWKDGLFSIALADVDSEGKRKAYFHPLVSTQEFSVDTALLRSRESLEGHVKLLGTKGPRSQSGSHAYHSATRTMLFASVAQDAILCWNIDTELTEHNVAVVLQDHVKLIYISDLKIVGDDVWVLVNQITRFVYSTLNPNEKNYYIHSGRVENLIRGTPCDIRNKY